MSPLGVRGASHSIVTDPSLEPGFTRAFIGSVGTRRQVTIIWYLTFKSKDPFKILKRHFLHLWYYLVCIYHMKCQKYPFFESLWFELDKACKCTIPPASVRYVLVVSTPIPASVLADMVNV